MSSVRSKSRQEAMDEGLVEMLEPVGGEAGEFDYTITGRSKSQ